MGVGLPCVEERRDELSNRTEDWTVQDLTAPTQALAQSWMTRKARQSDLDKGYELTCVLK